MSEKPGASHEDLPSGDLIKKIGVFVTNGLAKVVDILFPSGH